MLEEAEQFEEQDRKERERVEARNTLEGYVFSTKSTLAGAEGGRLNDQLSDEEKETIDKALEEANEWLDDHQDAEREALDEKLDELKSAVGPIIKMAYERAGTVDP